MTTDGGARGEGEGDNPVIIHSSYGTCPSVIRVPRVTSRRRCRRARFARRNHPRRQIALLPPRHFPRRLVLYTQRGNFGNLHALTANVLGGNRIININSQTLAERARVRKFPTVLNYFRYLRGKRQSAAMRP